MKKYQSVVKAMISLSILFPSNIQKLEGIVIDFETGKLLSQANIQIVGTELGLSLIHI